MSVVPAGRNPSTCLLDFRSHRSIRPSCVEETMAWEPSGAIEDRRLAWQRHAQRRFGRRQIIGFENCLCADPVCAAALVDGGVQRPAPGRIAASE